MSTGIVTRQAGLRDLDAILADVAAGFASYVEFAPAGWQPPEVDRGSTAELLADPGTWALLALVGDRVAGHVAFMPARGRAIGEARGEWRSRPLVPGLAHLWQLFVLPEWWGRGVAGPLHDQARDEMRAQGYRAARLFTPSEHERARRFYERRGWRASDEGWNEGLGLALTEYRLGL